MREPADDLTRIAVSQRLRSSARTSLDGFAIASARIQYDAAGPSIWENSSTATSCIFSLPVAKTFQIDATAGIGDLVEFLFRLQPPGFGRALQTLA